MTNFHDVRFPLHLAFGARGGPVRSVDILELVNGSEVRNARGRHSRRQYNAVAGLKSRHHAIELINFFESRNGPLYGFRFHDPLDYEAEAILGIGDGARIAVTELITAPLQGAVSALTSSIAGTTSGKSSPVTVNLNLAQSAGKSSGPQASSAQMAAQIAQAIGRAQTRN